LSGHVQKLRNSGGKNGVALDFFGIFTDKSGRGSEFSGFSSNVGVSKMLTFFTIGGISPLTKSIGG
jgi:hypothetical protein